MIAAPFEALADIGATWQDWGGVWGSSSDPVHFEIPGSRSYILQHLSLSALATGIDFAISFLPAVGVATTFASILSLFPQWSHNAVLDAISSPAGTLLETFQPS